MVHVIKVCVDNSSLSEKQIRRVAVSSDIIGSFKLLEKKIVDLFSFFNDKVIEIKWKDSDNDFICISSDEELAQAVANMEDGILRLFVNAYEDNESNNAKNPKKQNKEHPGIVCDGCNKFINGSRYKCLQCKDFDLCSTCNENDKHPEHDFLKLIKPVHIPREWVFLGSRKLWKSMFHTLRSSNFQKCCADNKNKFAESGASSGKCEPDANIFSTFLTGNYFNEAQNFFHKVLEDINALNMKGNSTAPNPHNTFNSEKKKEEKKETKENKADCSLTSNDKKCTKLSETDNANEIVETKEGHTEPKICIPVAGECSYNNENSKPDGPVLKNDKISSVQDTIVSDGWTILHNDENEDTSSPAQLCETEKTSVYPSLEHHVDVLQENEVHPSLDAKIASAVETMKSMGFTNENRWLEHLLLTKNGNITEALDALYPSMMN